MVTNNKVFTIYLLTNLVNGKKYVGQTKQKLSERICKHRSDSKNAKQLISKAIAKHGWENFDVDIIGMAFTQESANELESSRIKEHSSLAGHGYNVSTGGHSGFNLCENEITKRSVRQKLVCKKTKITVIKDGVAASFFSIYEAADNYEISPCRIHDALKRRDRSSVGMNFIKPNEFESFRPQGSIRKHSKPVLAISKKTGHEIALSAVKEVTRIGARRTVVPKCIRNSKLTSGGYHFRYISIEEFFNHPNKLLPQ